MAMFNPNGVWGPIQFGQNDNTGDVNYDPNNQGGGFDWNQYTGGVTGPQGGTALGWEGEDDNGNLLPGYHYEYFGGVTGGRHPVPDNPNAGLPTGMRTIGGSGASTSGNSGAWDQNRFMQEFGSPGTPQELEALEQRLNAVGIRVSRNAAGVAGKIILPNGQYVDVINSAGLGGRGFQWLTDEGGGGQQGGSAQPYNFSTDDPSYKWRLEQGMDALQKSAAARGTLLTGGTLKDLTNYAQGAASQEYGAAFGRKATLADMGLRAAGGQVGAAGAYGNNATNQIGNIGNANSAGSIGQGNIWGPWLNNAGR